MSTAQSSNVQSRTEIEQDIADQIDEIDREVDRLTEWSQREELKVQRAVHEPIAELNDRKFALEAELERIAQMPEQEFKDTFSEIKRNSKQFASDTKRAIREIERILKS